MTSKTFKGVVQSIQPWHSGKGYFLRLDTTEEEFYKFGAPRFDTDVNVTINAEPGNNRFSDKWEIKKIAPSGGEGEIAAKPTPEPEPAAPEQKIDFEKKGKDRETGIRRAVALKAAVELEVALLVPEAGPDKEKTISEVLLTAAKLEKYLEVR